MTLVYIVLAWLFLGVLGWAVWLADNTTKATVRTAANDTLPVILGGPLTLVLAFILSCGESEAPR